MSTIFSLREKKKERVRNTIIRREGGEIEKRIRGGLPLENKSKKRPFANVNIEVCPCMCLKTEMGGMQEENSISGHLLLKSKNVMQSMDGLARI